jgi:hypothetical protein
MPEITLAGLASPWVRKTRALLSLASSFFFFLEVRKILFVDKRRERLHTGECRGTWKPVIP